MLVVKYDGLVDKAKLRGEAGISHYRIGAHLHLETGETNALAFSFRIIPLLIL
jgi:hypothetical protein